LRERIIAELVSFFSGFALLLTCLGLYGILSFQVAQRTREIGVRVALGATLRSVIGMVSQQALKLVLLGGAVGLVVALATTRSLAALLYGVTPVDPTTFAAALLLLVSAAVLASWVPARRATKVDPMVALRSE
jgi:ABC-type antimicrobial peptide transport system permease subunit